MSGVLIVDCRKVSESVWNNWFRSRESTLKEGKSIGLEVLACLNDTSQRWVLVDSDRHSGDGFFRAYPIFNAEELQPQRPGRTKFIVLNVEYGFERIVRFTEATLYGTGEIELSMAKKNHPNDYVYWTTLYLMPLSLWNRVAGIDESQGCVVCQRTQR